MTHKAEEARRIKEEFVANVSHELRTPLSLIAGCVETLIDGAREDPAATDRFLRMIQKHTERLTFLLEDLLTLSQLESGRTLFHFQTVDLHGAVDRLLEDLRLRADAQQVTFRNQAPEAIFVRADSQRLSQVLMNLVDNAIKYGGPEGTIEVGARLADQETVEVWVRDDGPGIPAHALERVFERFYRVDRARSRDQGGTGLGLSIVKHIIQSHGGKVWVASELGKGATFFFTLPSASGGREPEFEGQA
jgi:two-component system phosphate regulon sensor histidine kinase PhoR